MVYRTLPCVLYEVGNSYRDKPDGPGGSEGENLVALPYESAT